MKVLTSNIPGLRIPATSPQQPRQKKVHVRVMAFKDVRPGTLFAPALYKVTIVDGHRTGYHFRTERPRPTDRETQRLEKRGIALYSERVKSATFVKSAALGGQAAGLAAGAEHAGLVIFHPMQECVVAYWGL